MSFENPNAFFLLLSIPLIFLFHFFKARRREVLVGSLLFWEMERSDQQQSTPFRRFQVNRLLFLQILAVLFLTFALASPTLFREEKGYERTVLILDASASMQATDLPGGRFQAVKREALALVERLRPGQTMMVIEAGSTPRVIVPFTGEKAVLTKALEAFRPQDVPGRLLEALRFATTLLKADPSASLHVFTDLAFEMEEAFQGLKLPIHWHVFGRGGHNVGITAFEVRKAYYGSYDYQIFLSLANYGKKAASFNLRLFVDGRPLSQRRVDLSPEVKRSFVFPFTSQAGGVLKATIDPHDDLAVDDTAYAILPSPKFIKVLLVSSGNLFLEKALASDPQLEVERRQPKGDLDPRGYDVVIFDGSAPKVLPSGGYLLINTLSKNVPLEALGKVEEPQILEWDRTHPVMRYLDLSKVLIQEAMKVRPLGGGRALLESSLTPLMYTFEEKERKVIFVGFDLYKSDLPLRTAFPIFISNALRWLSLGHQEAGVGVKGGQTLTLEFPPEASEAVVIDPEGKTHRVPLEGGKLSFGETRKAGVYTVKVQEEEQKVAVNLFEEEESKIIPRARLPKEMETQGDVRFRVRYEFWPFLAFLALGVLFLEGLLFLRSTGFTPPIVFRGLLLLLLLLAFLRPKVPYRSDRVNILFLLDTSDSIPFEKRLSAFASLKEAARFMGEEDTAGLLLFGAEPSLVVPPERGFRLPERLPPLPPSRATDIEKAIHLALAAFPQEGKKRIVLLSDGNENRGSALEAAEAARAERVEIYSVPLRQTFEGEVVVEGMILPQEVKEGEAFIVKIVAWSAKEGGAHLSLFRDGSFVGSQKVRLNPGKNVFAYQQALEEPGFHLYQVRLEAEGDSIEENNRAIGVVAVKGRPHVLYIEKDREQGQHLVKALQAQGIQVELVGPEDLPKTLEALLKYDLLIFSNVSSLTMTKAQMEMIRSFVRDQGGGLLMVGGEESFGLGGYYRTPIEEALPVTMEARQKLEIPSLALVLVIDRSGSMETAIGPFTKLDLAKEAAQLVVELLEERNEAGVIAFDTTWNWVVPIGPAKEKAGILREIASIKAGGGTDMFPALKEAYQVLYERNALLKHVIVLSDGQSTSADFAGLVKRMARDKITVSTVAIGKDADVTLMLEISRLGKGRFYYTDDPYSLPRIFTLETQLASKAALVEQPFRPRLANAFHEILQEIEWEKVPPLGGYVATTPKTTADLLLLSPHKDPILAVWRYGLGRAAAFTSDFKAKWGVLWLRWEGFSKFLAQLARWTLRRGGAGEALTTVAFKGGKGEVIVEAVDQNGEFVNLLEVQAGIVFPDKSQAVVPLQQVAPGRYKGSFRAEEEGAYLVGVARKRGERMVGSEVGSLVVPYSPEHRILEANEALLRDLAFSTGGGVLEEVSQAFRRSRETTKIFKEIWPWILLVTFALFFGELALRLFFQAQPVAFRPKGKSGFEVELYVKRGRAR